MAAPVYIQRQNTQGLGLATVMPQVANEQTNGAIARFGAALSGVAQVAGQAYAVFDQTNRATTIASRTTGYLKDVDALEQEFQNDPDPGTAPQRFGERVEKLKTDATVGLRPEDQSELDLKLTRLGLSSVGGVRQSSLRRQADQFGADMDVQYDALQKRYVAAGSDAERQAVNTEWNTTLTQGVRRGVMTAQRATAYQQSLNKSGDEAIALRAIATSPQRALAAFDDPAQFAGFDPATRERYRAQARAASDEAASQRLAQQARFNPGASIATVGRVNSVEQGDVIFDRGIIQQESGGNPNAPRSSKGAVSISQMLPDTARAMASKLGLADVANMGNLGLQQRLREDPQLALRLGREYFREGLRRTDGSVPAAIAGYHMGVERGAEYHRKAVAQFGASYTAEQFAGLIPDSMTDGAKKTSDYVRDVIRRVGGETNGGGLSPSASWRTQGLVNSELQTQAAGLSRQEAAMISLGQQGATETIANFNQGYARDPGIVAQQRAMLNLGASRGDGSSMQKLRELDEAESAAPIIREAYQTRPDQLAGGIAQMRQQMATMSDVPPALMRRLRLFEGVAKEVAAGRNDDPVALGVRAGIVPATSLPDPAQASDPNFVDAIARRSVAAERSQQAYGGAMKFFTATDRPTYKAAFEAAADTGKVDMLRALSRGASPAAYEAAVSEIAGASPVMQLAGRMARTDEQTAREILRGTSLMADKGYAGPKAEEMKAALKDKIGGDLFPGEHQAAVIDAALAIYAAERGKNWQLYDATDRAGLTRAIEKAAGGTIAKINGAHTVLPRGMTEAQFGGMLRALDENALLLSGGANVPAAMVRNYGQLVRVSQEAGQYAVMLPQGGRQRPVVDAMGQPLILDFDRLARDPRYALAGQFRGEAAVPAVLPTDAVREVPRLGADAGFDALMTGPMRGRPLP
jgi:hypothetical protein